jgi:ribonuclease R
LCSLQPAVDRACLAIHLWIDEAGRLQRHRLVRGLMRSAARLTYEQVQGQFEAGANPLLPPLYAAFRALDRQRRERGSLDLDLPEFRVRLDAAGNPIRIDRQRRLDSHRLIEAFMVAANVAAAEMLGARRLAGLYRIHDRPDPERLDSLRQVLDGLGVPTLRLAKGQIVQPAHFTRLLAAAEGLGEAALINEMVLRSQAQAAYSPLNIGHFGLALREYAHFTSPIRRYADLVVHRALLAGSGLGEGGAAAEDAAALEGLGRHITTTERRAARAERDTVDRYVSRFMHDHVGAVFGARITGVARFGVFVTLDETGADGLIPVQALPRDEYRHDRQRHLLTGKRTRSRYTLGQKLQVRLVEADAVGAGLVFALAEAESPAAGRRRRAPALKSP